MTPAEARTDEFLKHIQTVYSVKQRYHPTQHRVPLEVTTSASYASSRREAVDNLIKSRRECKDDYNKSVLSEWATYICIASPLSNVGLTTQMAAPELEQGDAGRKGVDLVVSKRTYDTTALPLLGINVKLRRARADTRTDRQKLDPTLCAPSISIALGNWQTTPNQDPTQIRDWMTEHVLPRIQEGKTIYVNDLKGYIFGRIARTLESYRWKTEHYSLGEYTPSEMESDLFPLDPSDYASFQDKLALMHEVFMSTATKLSSYKPYHPLEEYR